MFTATFPSRRREQKTPRIKAARKFKHSKTFKRYEQEKSRSSSPPDGFFKSRFSPTKKSFDDTATTTTTTKFPKPSTLIQAKQVSPTPVPRPTAPPSETNPKFAPNENPQTATTTNVTTKQVTAAEDTNTTSSTGSTTAFVDPYDGTEDDVTSFLCLVPLINKFQVNDNPVIERRSYWPCLVFSSVKSAQQWHHRLYPDQTKIQKKLANRHMKLEKQDHPPPTTVTLPLKDSKGVCPSDICGKPLYNAIDFTPKDTERKYWTTLPKKKSNVVEANKKVIRLLQNLDCLPTYLQEAKKQIQLEDIGDMLKDALNEMERLFYLGYDSDDDDDDSCEGDFVPSLQIISQDEPQTKEPIRFPVHVNPWPGKSSKRETSAVQFPRKRTAPVLTEPAKKTRAVSTDASFQSPTETTATRVSFPSWTSPPAKPSKMSMESPEASTVATNDSSKKRKGRSNVIDSQDRISVSAWSEVQPLLEALGHAFYQTENGQFFCRPNGNPREHPEAVEGTDYFASMHDYRAYLCAHGVEYWRPTKKSPKATGTNLSCLGDDELELIAYWVRFHVFSQRPTGQEKPERIPDLELRGKNKRKYVSLLQRIGYKYGSRGLCEGYSVPGEAKKRYLSEKDLWEHLGKHGLSSHCKFEQFESSEEQTALEIEMIRNYHGNHGDKAFRLVDKLTKHTPAANKDALQECTRGPQGEAQFQMSPRKLMVEEEEEEEEEEDQEEPVTENSEDTTGKDEMVRENSNEKTFKEKESLQETTETIHENTNTSAKNDSNETNTTKADKENTDASGSSNPAKSTNNSEESRNTTAQASVSQKVNNVAIEEADIPEVDLPGTSNVEKLDSCLRRLRNNEIVAYGELSNSMARIRSFIETVIETKGREGDGKNRIPMLYVCGNPGTGKTMSTTTLCREAISAKKKSLEEWEKAPRFEIISCPSFQGSKYQDGMNRILNDMKLKEKQLKRSSNDDSNAAIILILDEVDQLVGSKGTESIFKQLSSWAQDENNVLSIIGISNSVFNSKTTRLREYGMGGASNQVVFRTYRKEDLVKISQAKIGFSVVHQKAHEFIAAKVANSSGDARQYLDLVQKAIIYCKRKMKLEKQVEKHNKAIVTIRDAMMAIRETNQKCKETIQCLTSFEQMTLCAGVHLARKLGGKTVQMGKLRELTMQAVGMDADVSLEEFKGIIERLSDNGLLILNQTEKQAFTKIPMYGLLRYPVSFDLQLEDVDSALEDTLMKQDFYKRMVERLNGVTV